MPQQATQAAQVRPVGRFIAAARVFTGLTFISRIFGLVRDTVFAAVFGATTITDSFSFAFMIPNLFRRLFGEGALSSSLIPVLTDYDVADDPARREQALRLVHAVVTLLAMFLAAVTILVEAGLLVYRLGWATEPSTRLVIGLTAVMFPFVILVCVAALLSAVLNVKGRFAEGAAGPIILNICQIVAAALVAPRISSSAEMQIFVVAGSVLLGGLLQLLLIQRALRIRGVPLRIVPDWRHPGVQRVMLMTAPMVLPLAVVQINSLIDQAIAWTFTARDGLTSLHVLGLSVPRFLDEGAVFSLGLAARLYEMPLGVFSVALATAIFPAMARHGSQDDKPALADTLRRGLEIAMLIAIPASVGLVLLREDIVRLLFEHGRFRASDTPVVADAMAFYAIGLAVFSGQQLLIRAFYAIKKIRSVVWVAVAMVALNLPLNIALVLAMRHVGGLALSTTICAVIQCALLALMLRRQLGRLGGRRVLASAGKTVVAAAALGVAVWATQWALANWSAGADGKLTVTAMRAVRVLLPIGAGMVVFYVVARRLRIEALRAVMSRE